MTKKKNVYQLEKLPNCCCGAGVDNGEKKGGLIFLGFVIAHSTQMMELAL